LFRWFVGLGIDDPVWHPTAFTTNRERLLEGEVATKFLSWCWAIGSRSAPIAATIPPTSSPHCAGSMPRPTWRRTFSRRASRIDRRTLRYPGYLASQRARKRIEEAFAWIKTIARQAKTSFRGTARVGRHLAAAANISSAASIRRPARIFLGLSHGGTRNVRRRPDPRSPEGATRLRPGAEAGVDRSAVLEGPVLRCP
jgi:hypothetical protein